MENLQPWVREAAAAARSLNPRRLMESSLGQPGKLLQVVKVRPWRVEGLYLHHCRGKLTLCVHHAQFSGRQSFGKDEAARLWALGHDKSVQLLVRFDSDVVERFESKQVVTRAGSHSCSRLTYPLLTVAGTGKRASAASSRTRTSRSSGSYRTASSAPTRTLETKHSERTSSAGQPLHSPNRQRKPSPARQSRTSSSCAYTQ